MFSKYHDFVDAPRKRLHENKRDKGENSRSSMGFPGDVSFSAWSLILIRERAVFVVFALNGE
jgi:hypothetical protein